MPEAERPPIYSAAGLCEPAPELEVAPAARQYTGRWGVRAEYPLRLTGFVELAMFQVANLEVGGGVEARLELGDPIEVTPYTVVAYYAEGHWITFEAAVPVDLLPVQRVGFGLAVGVGGRF